MQALIDQLKSFQLPVLCDLAQIKQQLNQPNMAAADLLPVIEHDPVFSLYIQRLAGEMQKGRGGEIAGLEHALSMCGIDSILQLTAQLRTPQKRLSAPFRQLVAESVLASKLAARLAHLRGSNEKESQAMALFARAYEWLLYWEHPRRSWQARRMAYRRPFSHDSVQETLFNLKAADLQLAIAEEFHLPFLSQRLARFTASSVARPLIDAVRQFRQGSLLLEDCSRELRLYLGAPEMTAVIANRLAQAACSPWLVNAWPRWMDIAAIHCHKKPAEVTRICLETIRKVAELPLEFAEFGLASALVCEPSKAPYQQFLVKPKDVKLKKRKRSDGEVVKKVTVQNTSSSTNESQQKNTVQPKSRIATKPAIYDAKQKSSLLSFCRRLNNDEDPEFKDLALQELVQQALFFLVEKTPLERASFLILNKEQSKCKSMLSECKAFEEKPLQIVTELERTRVWQKFTTQPAFLTFDKVKHQKYWAQLPAAISEDSRINFFLFHSIRYGGRVRGFLYADMAHSSRRLSEEFNNDFKRFVKILASRLSRYLKSL